MNIALTNSRHGLYDPIIVLAETLTYSREKRREERGNETTNIVAQNKCIERGVKVEVVVGANEESRYTNTHTNTQTHKHTNTHTNTRTHTHTNTRTHVHTQRERERERMRENERERGKWDSQKCQTFNMSTEFAKKFCPESLVKLLRAILLNLCCSCNLRIFPILRSLSLSLLFPLATRAIH